MSCSAVRDLCTKMRDSAFILGTQAVHRNGQLGTDKQVHLSIKGTKSNLQRFLKLSEINEVP